MLHLTSGVALAMIGGAALLVWRAAPAMPPESNHAANGATTALQRARFMELGGLILCVFFALVVLATELPALLLDPCAW